MAVTVKNARFVSGEKVGTDTLAEIIVEALRREKIIASIDVGNKWWDTKRSNMRVQKGQIVSSKPRGYYDR